jgi:hypothetical protein
MKAGRESHRWPNTDSVGARLSAYSDNLQLRTWRIPVGNLWTPAEHSATGSVASSAYPTYGDRPSRGDPLVRRVLPVDPYTRSVSAYRARRPFLGGNGPAGRRADHQNERTFSDEIRPGATRLAPYHTPKSGGRAMNQVEAPICAWKAFCSS